MKPAYEKLIPPAGQSFHCFNRATLTTTNRWHHHSEIELTYVERGSGTRIVGDNIASYGDHDLILLGPNLPHVWQSHELAGRMLDLQSAVVVQFLPEFLGSDFFAAPEFTAVREMLDAASRGLKFDGDTAIRVGQQLFPLIHESPPLKLIGLLRCLVELAELRTWTPLASLGFSSRTVQAGPPRLEEIFAFIAENSRDPKLTHQHLAEMANMNPSAFSRFFRKATGKTVMAYLSEIRVGLACRLLTETNQKISQILEYAGFGNTSNFNRQFHRLKQMSPREYRKRHRAATAGMPAVLQSINHKE